MNKIRLVIVDDHKMFLEGIKAVLKKDDELEVVASFDNAKEAISFIKSNDLDLLITDISMPDMNGLEFVNTIKQDEPNLKILAVSMFEQIQSFDGLDGYLLKETGFKELKKAIHTIVVENKKYFYADHIEIKNDSLDFKKNILTKREKEIVVLIANQYSVDEIAKELFVSRHTVETHKKNIFLKLQVNNAAGLVKKAVYLGYI